MEIIKNTEIHKCVSFTVSNRDEITQHTINTVGDPDSAVQEYIGCIGAERLVSIDSITDVSVDIYTANTAEEFSSMLAMHPVLGLTLTTPK